MAKAKSQTGKVSGKDSKHKIGNVAFWSTCTALLVIAGLAIIDTNSALSQVYAPTPESQLFSSAADQIPYEYEEVTAEVEEPQEQKDITPSIPSSVIMAEAQGDRMNEYLASTTVKAPEKDEEVITYAISASDDTQIQEQDTDNDTEVSEVEIKSFEETDVMIPNTNETEDTSEEIANVFLEDETENAQQQDVIEPEKEPEQFDPSAYTDWFSVMLNRDVYINENLLASGTVIEVREGYDNNCYQTTDGSYIAKTWADKVETVVENTAD